MQEIVCNDTKYGVLIPSGKSIIEEWRNPPKYPENLSQNDLRRGYEERAVDVAMDGHPQDLSKRTTQNAPPSRIANGNSSKNSNDAKLVKIRRPQGGGTVRSIPIKDYQASIAHNIGTLRRSAAPQSQFESLVSEPEKSIYVPSKKRTPIINSSHYHTASQTTMQLETTDKRSLCRFCNGQHDRCCANIDSNKTAEDDRYFNQMEDQKSQDGSVIDEYFRKSSRKRCNTSDFGRGSRGMRKSSRGGSAGTITTMADTRGEEAKAKETDALQLTEGHVGQKISAYEQNVRRSLRDSSPVIRYRSAFEGLKGHRSIGVPLVGMHNACGLPVVASWHDHELLEPLRISHGVVETVGPVYRSPRVVPNVRRRTQPKRKPPRPMDHATINSKDRNDKRSTVKSVTHLDTINGRSRRKHFRRSSFTATKVGSLSSKNSFKKTARSKRYSGIRTRSLMDTLSRRSLKGESAKRTTLYAKDDGDEAVRVLKSLCLNPLARTNPETDMMW
ncbi:hypothetical protein X777_10284 [Ooceraea biroi]|uniref:Uncharacterized protein n=1 Tax=Ooceraea biroi TaxID=2015173 RepID=A0A026W819_OOCBI|nr:hypothetical protein X777_10284 [Ooceraea biroi]